MAIKQKLEIFGSKDVLFALVLGLILSVFMIFYDFFDWFYIETRAHEDWELDEILCVIFGLLFAGSVLSVRRNVRLAKALTTLEESHKKIQAYEKERVIREKLTSLGQLASGMAHEINNGLQPILGLSEILKLQATENDHLPNEHIEMIHKNAVYISDIVQRVMEVSRSSAVSDEDHSVVPLLDDAIDFTIAMMPSTIEFHKIYKNDAITEFQDYKLNISRTSLIQVLTNLFKNAGQATDNVGGVLVFIQKEAIDSDTAMQHSIPFGAYVRVDVVDMGDGIDKSLMPYIFEPFYTSKTGDEGTGLGLSISYGLVRKWGGDIFVKSSKGQGTTFSFYIPLVRSNQDKACA